MSINTTDKETPMSITQDLKEQIAKHLPGMVGDQLKQRLIQADEDARTVVMLRDAVIQRDKAMSEANELKAFEQTVMARETAVAKSEQDLKLREALIQLREKHADERVKELRCVVADVFANSRMKYVESYSHNGYSPAGSTNHSGSRTVEQQG